MDWKFLCFSDHDEEDQHAANAKCKNWYKKFVKDKKGNYFFVSQKNEIFFFFDTWLYFCCYAITKIYQKYTITLYSKQCPKQNFDVARKTIFCRNKKFEVAQDVIWCRQKQVDVARKFFLRQTKKSWCCMKKCLMSTKTRWCCIKFFFLCSKKLLIFPERRAI